MMKNKTVNLLTRILVVMLSACIYAFFFKVIVEGRGFLAMGVSGLAVILSRSIGSALNKENLISIMYMIFYITINIPLFIFAYKKISKKFVFLSMVFVFTFSIVVGFIPSSLANSLEFYKLDDLTAAILIGLVSGFACAITLFMGGCAGGLDIISTYLNVKKGKGIGAYSFAFNTGILFIGLSISTIPAIIYTLVYAFFSSTILDRYYNRNRKILLEIITSKKDEICNYILNTSHHGCTIVDAKGAFTSEDKYIIHAVVSMFQLKNITKDIKNIDENCFIIDLNVYNVTGFFYLPPIK